MEEYSKHLDTKYFAKCLKMGKIYQILHEQRNNIIRTNDTGLWRGDSLADRTTYYQDLFNKYKDLTELYYQVKILFEPIRHAGCKTFNDNEYKQMKEALKEYNNLVAKYKLEAV